MDACYGHNVIGRSWADDCEDDWDPEVLTPFSHDMDPSLQNSEMTSKGEHHAPDCPTIEEADALFDDDNIRSQPEIVTDQDTDPSDNPWAPFLEVPYPYSPAMGIHPYTAYWLENGRPGKVAYPLLLSRGGGYTSNWQAMKHYRGWNKNKCMLYCHSPLRNEVKYEEVQSSTTPAGSPPRVPIEQQSTTPPGTPPRFWISWEYGADIIAKYQKNEAMFGHSSQQDVISSPIKFTCEDELVYDPAEDQETSSPSDAVLYTPTVERKRSKSFSVYKDGDNATGGAPKRARSFSVYKDDDSTTDAAPKPVKSFSVYKDDDSTTDTAPKPVKSFEVYRDDDSITTTLHVEDKQDLRSISPDSGFFFPSDEASDFLDESRSTISMDEQQENVAEKENFEDQDIITNMAEEECKAVIDISIMKTTLYTDKESELNGPTSLTALAEEKSDEVKIASNKPMETFSNPPFTTTNTEDHKYPHSPHQQLRSQTEETNRKYSTTEINVGSIPEEKLGSEVVYKSLPGGSTTGIHHHLSSSLSLDVTQVEEDLCRRLKAKHFNIRIAGKSCDRFYGSSIMQALCGNTI